MDTTVAYLIASRAHEGQVDRFGSPLVDHLARVAAAVPPEARPLAWLHDLLERTDTTVEYLRGAGLTPVEESALRLLTRRRGESYETYTLRLVFATGLDGRLAHTVKLADLDDHIAHARLDVDAPPYAWARRHIESVQRREREEATAA
jgi:hypothetical protein